MSLNFAEAKFGPKLKEEVESQLMDDLKHYGIKDLNMIIDWSGSCMEGHETGYLDGRLENWSGILVRDNQGFVVAEGWMEFICEVYPKGTPPLFIVFWDYLCAEGQYLKEKSGIPQHVMNLIPDIYKQHYTFRKGYWSHDPLVQRWLLE